MLNLEKMSTNKIRLLPAFLVRERDKANLSQKRLALEAGLFQTVVCAVEKGRRPSLGKDLIERLGAALRLDGATSHELRMLAEHDRIVAEVERGCLASSAALASAALLAGHYLDEEERAGLTLKIQRSVKSKTHLLGLRSQATASSEGDSP